MNVTEAKELIDAYGTNPQRWPSGHAADLAALEKGNKGFQTFLQEARELDKALAAWDADDDGVDVGEEGDDSAPAEPGPNSDQENTPSEGDEGEDGPLGGVGGLEALPGVEPPPPPQDEEPILINWEDVKDADECLEEALKEYIAAQDFDKRLQTDFTREYDRVTPAPMDPSIDILPTEDEVRRVAGVMQKHLQRVFIAKHQSYNVGGFRSGRINSPALHRVGAGDDRIFKRRHETETNKVAISLLVDNSGSMASGGKIKTAMTAAWAFADVLDRLKIPNEVLGFTTGDLPSGTDVDEFRSRLNEMIETTGLSLHSIRTNPTVIPIYKGFNERFGTEQKRRMVSMFMRKGTPMDENNDAMGLEYAGMRLHQRPETRKIMIVFSDGQPADGYISTGVLNYSTQKAVQKLEQAGIETIGIGIESDAVKQFYPKNFVIYNVGQLPGLVIKELGQLLS